MDQPTQLDDLAGKTLVERYHIHGRLGQGGMGSIYTAHDNVLDRAVAIKTVARNNLNDIELVRFHREGKAASTVRHPNVIQMLDFGVLESGQPFIVMELIKGISIAQLLRERGPQSILFTLQILEQIAEGMTAVHKAGIVHRDLKTSNIMIVDLDTSPLVRILDFGIAKSVAGEEQESTVTRAGQIFGSPNYMSPQQIKGEPLDRQADVYSLGCIAFEMLTGRTMFEGETVLELVTKHMNEPAPRLWEVSDKTFPMELERMVAHMVAKNTTERFPSMEVVIENIRDVRTVVEEAIEQEKLAKRDSGQLTGAELMRRNRRSASLLVMGIVLAAGVFIGAMVVVVNPMLSKEREIVRIAPAKVEDNHRQQKHDLAEHTMDFLEAGGQTAERLGFLVDESGRSTETLENAIKTGKRSDRIIISMAEITVEHAKLIQQLKPYYVKFRKCTGLNVKVLKELAKTKSLQQLSFDQSTGIPPKAFSELAALPSLTRLLLRDCKLTDEHLKEIGKIGSLLQVFCERNPGITLKGVKYLGGKMLAVGVVVDQPNLLVLSGEAQKQLLKHDNIQLQSAEELSGEDISLKKLLDDSGFGAGEMGQMAEQALDGKKNERGAAVEHESVIDFGE